MRLLYSVLVIFATLVVAMASAYDTRDAKDCANDVADRMLGACSRIASSTNASNEEKAKALSNRAWAHNVKDMSDAAIADANEAIRLNPRSWVPTVTGHGLTSKKVSWFATGCVTWRSRRAKSLPK
jgi:hypothetical protein